MTSNRYSNVKFYLSSRMDLITQIVTAICWYFRLNHCHFHNNIYQQSESFTKSLIFSSLSPPSSYSLPPPTTSITQYMKIIVLCRPLVKWFLRQTTRLCELQRICYGETSGAPRTIAVGESSNNDDDDDYYYDYYYCREFSGSFEEPRNKKVVNNDGEEGGGDDKLGGDESLPRLNVQPDHEDQGDQSRSSSTVCSVNDHLFEADVGLQTAQIRSRKAQVKSE